MADEKKRPYAGIFHDDYEGAKTIIQDPSELLKLLCSVIEYSMTGEIIDTSEESPSFRYFYQTMTRKIDYQEAVYRKKVEGGRKGGQSKAKKDKDADNREKEIEKQLAEIKDKALGIGWGNATPKEWDAIKRALGEGYNVEDILAAMAKTHSQSTVTTIKDRGSYMLITLKHNN